MTVISSIFCAFCPERRKFGSYYVRFQRLPSRVCLAVLIWATCLSSFPAKAFIDVALQMQLGNPSGAAANTNNHDHYLIQRSVETMDYSDNLREPNWVSWDLTVGDIGSSGRSSDFFTDTNLPPNFYAVLPTDYSGSGFDRGHMCPSADRTDNVVDNDLVFRMSNIIPQASQNNQGVWANFEDECRTLAQAGNELLITCGPSGFNGSRTTSAGSVAIPAYTWKIAVVVPSGPGTALSRISTATRVIALRIPNSNTVVSSWQSYVTSVDQIQVDTGFTFFSALPTNVATVLRGRVDGLSAPPPVVTGFSPTNGPAGSVVVISGTNFTSASTVTFNGAAAAFTVNSTTQITATVPAFASSGIISVTTPAGTAISGKAFAVTGTVLDLALMASHVGVFAQGGNGYVYSIVLANVGNIPSSGPVSVADLLPTGLTAVGFGGPGWTTDSNSLTATRSDALQAGASYPALTLTVNVATNAPASLTNLVSFSGGGDTNSLNNAALDPTSIDASGIIVSTNVVTLVGWDVSGLAGGLNNFGPPLLLPTTNVPQLNVVGLTRGSGVGTSGSGAAHGWGGNTFNSSSSAAALAASQYVTFSASPVAGSRVSFGSISRFDYRHSGTGPMNGLLQYQLGSGPFLDITSVSYPVNTSSGASLGPIDLSSVTGLQNVGPGTNVTFRIVNWGGTSSAGTWYVFQTTNSSPLQLAFAGTITPLNPPVADLTLALSHAGNLIQADSGDTYSITVTNVGLAATSGQIAVAVVVPPGLVATAITGQGWTADLGTLTCVRSDVLAPGATFPPVNVLVDVATNAPASVTTFATVSGGGQTNKFNDLAGDPTTILPLTPIQQWRYAWFGSTANLGESSDAAVSSLDGLPNLLKYALGLNPLLPAANPFVVDTATGYLRITLPRNAAAADVTFHVESTADLSQPWSPDSLTVDQNTPSLLQVHFQTPVSAGAGARFIRVRVTRP